jgi:hypothetical protein
MSLAPSQPRYRLPRAWDLGGWEGFVCHVLAADMRQRELTRLSQALVANTNDLHHPVLRLPNQRTSRLASLLAQFEGRKRGVRLLHHIDHAATDRP